MQAAVLNHSLFLNQAGLAGLGAVLCGTLLLLGHGQPGKEGADRHDNTMMVASALISGDRPRRTLEKMSIGSVVLSGPAMKLVITRSSIDMVKDKSRAATSAGIMAGRMMAKKT